MFHTGTEFTELQLKRATDNFSQSRLIGKGGYGTVYQGYINCSTVAVKVLKKVFMIQIVLSGYQK